jgi:DNA polymerase-3 subunit delta'
MLSDVLGQAPVLAALRQSLLTDHLAQTYLFSGEHQVGKTTTAINLAKVLLCDRRQPGDPDCCDQCSACTMIESRTHPDVRLASPTGPSQMLRIAQFWPRDGVKDHPADRAMLRDLHFAPVSGKRRVFIIEAAESMNEDTANSLLKVLEEPPPYATFILTAVSTQAVLPTILSRSQVLRFRPVAENAICDELIRRNVSSTHAAVLAAYAQGRPGIAFRAAAAMGVMAGRDDVLQTAAASSSGLPTIAAFKVADDLRKASAKLVDTTGQMDDVGARTLLTSACDVLLYWYRDLLVCRATSGQGRILNADHAPTVAKHSQRYSVDELERATALIQDTRRYIGRNANAQVATEYLMLNLLALGH